MQGAYRLLLAMLVVVHHLAHDYAWFAGNFAVLGFYALSGYLITLTLRRNYTATLDGLWRFGLNRFLRIFPAYWTVLAIAVPAVLLFPAYAATVNPVMSDPASGRFGWLGWLPQVTMVGLQVPPGLLWPERVIPPAWSTAIELYFYFFLFLSCFIPDRSFRWVCLSSLAVGIACAATGAAQWTYTSLPGVSVLFAAGSLAYRERALLDRLRASMPWLTQLIIALFIVVAFAPDLYHPLRDEIYLVWMQYAAAPLVAYLAFSTVSCPLQLPLSRWMGDMAYPVFLAHFPMAVWMKAAGLQGAIWFVASVSATLALSIFVVAFVEHPVATLRARVRAGDWDNG